MATDRQDGDDAATVVFHEGVRQRARPPVRVVCTDLDGTLLGSPIAAERFAANWSALPEPERPRLIYNTGRTLRDVESLVAARRLPAADFVIGAIGTELGGAGPSTEREFHDRLWQDWNRLHVDRIVRDVPGVRPQALAYLNVHKSSWIWERATSSELERLRNGLHNAGLRANVIYSCRQFLDVVPITAGKGLALGWLCARLGIDLHEVVVCGDTANDAAMFELPGVRGIVVGNALPELLSSVRDRDVYVAAGWMAEGLIQGLRHFGVFVAGRAATRSETTLHLATVVREVSR